MREVGLLTAIVGENTSVTRLEVKGAGLRVTNKNSGTSVTLVEVEPFLSLGGG